MLSNIQYSAYVIYDDNVQLSRDWVIGTLLPEVETILQKPPMFIDNRNQLPGKMLYEVVCLVSVNPTILHHIHFIYSNPKIGLSMVIYVLLVDMLQIFCYVLIAIGYCLHIL